MIGHGREGRGDDAGVGDVVGDGSDVSKSGYATCSTPILIDISNLISVTVCLGILDHHNIITSPL